jgi:hypothetical protein
MVTTNNDITQKKYKKLSIQVALNGLSFCVFDLITHTISHSNTITFTKNQVIEEELWKVFVDYPVLNDSYDQVMLIHDNNLNTFVPNSLFDANFLGSYLQYNVKVFETDLFAYDSLENYSLQNVHVPYVNINNFLLDQYPTFDYQNCNTILVSKLLGNSSFTDEKQVYIHVQEGHFELVVLKNKELLFFNSFEYQTPEDFIYYVLFAFEQLQLNPETISVQLLGDIQENDANFSIAYTYIRNCQLLDVSQLEAKLNINATTIRKNFILYQS